MSRDRRGLAAGVAAPLLAALALTCAQGDSTETPPGTGGGTQTSTTATTATTTGSAGSGGGGGELPTGCTSDADCADPSKPRCDTDSGACVGCLPDVDPCPVGQWCNPANDTCAVGCSEDEDCKPGGDLVCDKDKHACVGCVIDTECPPGTICLAATCVPGCTSMQPCQAQATCCGMVCKDVATDPENCGTCNKFCDPPPNAPVTCVAGMCGMGPCTVPFADCNLDPADGCEHNVAQDDDCACVPGSTESCYAGAPGTENVGPCHAGTRTCDATGLAWGPCTGQVVPAGELCANGIDEDCNGIVDDGTDADLDGWSACEGDCCDSAACASDPKLVNPGAFEVIGNGVDDDCNPATSDTVAPAPCSTVQKLTAVTGDDIAKAIDLCQFTTPNPPKALKKWGVISTAQLLAAGNAPAAAELANMQNWQSAVMTDYGTAVGPTKGPTMAGIMSGKMRDVGDAGYVQPNQGTNFGTVSQAPVVYLNAHGGQLPASQGCSGACTSGTGANDSINVKLTIRVPTNAQSFSYQFKFYTAEYWGFSCSIYNDFYLALLQSAAPGLPLDTNISFDGLGNPVSVNNGFFNVCHTKGCYTCPSGTAALAGTGMDEVVCSGSSCGETGGGTNWLTTDAPVVPGETIVLQLMVFDVTGHILDSLALLDNFTWGLAPAQVGTHE